MIETISVRGARQHNLKNISFDIPRDRLTVVTGLSGSGKSSLAFDILYAEGQRRYVETLSPYARQFLDQMEKPEVDSIEGLSPAIAIEQKTTSRNPRSTVGTITEVYDFLRLLYSSIGAPHCSRCGKKVSKQTTQQIVQNIFSLDKKLSSEIEGLRVMVLAPVIRGRKGEFRKLFEEYAKKGFLRARIDGTLRQLDDDIHLSRHKNHTIEVVVDRRLVRGSDEHRLTASIEVAMKLAKGLVQIAVIGGEEHFYSQVGACAGCGLSLPTPEPRSFSFNSPYGACKECRGLGNKYDFDSTKVIVDRTKPLFDGGLGPGSSTKVLRRALLRTARLFDFNLATPFHQFPKKVQDLILFGRGARTRSQKSVFPGIIPLLQKWYVKTPLEKHTQGMEKYMSAVRCPLCDGRRLRAESLAVVVNRFSIADLTALSINRASEFIRNIRPSERERILADRILSEIAERLRFLKTVGLGYLSLDRSASTLSSGEMQRIRLATQIGSKLRGVLYVLDEPSIGLHSRDNERLLKSLESLRDLGNTVLVVEHDEETIRRADHVIDLGPRAGNQGGQLVACGTPAEIMKIPESLTGKYLAGNLQVPVPSKQRPLTSNRLSLLGAQANNLKNIDVHFPLGTMNVITGVSGSGKSTLVYDTLYRALAQKFYRAQEKSGAYTNLLGTENIDKVVVINQSPIGRTPRSNPATYTGVFTPIRELFAMLPESRARGYKAGRFSFNLKGGRCEICSGDGLRRIEMSFLPDVFVTCDACRGRRYNSETLTVKFKGYSIADLLESTAHNILPTLENIPQIKTKLQTLVDVGLGYLQLGQSATTLSGGEAQRIKLAKELSRRQTGRTLYILDEPTTGLHLDDIRKLLEVLNRLTDLGNTVIIIEHQLDVIKQADWVLDLGPEGGEGGGYIVAQGRPAKIIQTNKSYTGQALRSATKNIQASCRNKPRKSAAGSGRGKLRKSGPRMDRSS